MADAKPPATGWAKEITPACKVGFLIAGAVAISLFIQWSKEGKVADYACDIVMRIAPSYEDDETFKAAIDAALAAERPPPKMARPALDDVVKACDNEEREYKKVLLPIRPVRMPYPIE